MMTEFSTNLIILLGSVVALEICNCMVPLSILVYVRLYGAAQHPGVQLELHRQLATRRCV